MTSEADKKIGPGEGARGPVIDQGTREGLRRRDPDAMERFFRSTFDTIYGLAFRMLGNQQAAEDVTQEVFLRVHRAADSLDPDRDPLPWLRTITANLCRDHWRSFDYKVSHKSVSMDDDERPGPPLAVEERSADEDLLDAERDMSVQRAIELLPDELREVVVLRDYERLDHKAIAEIVGASHAAVRKRYSRALQQLGKLLEDEWA